MQHFDLDRAVLAVKEGLLRVVAQRVAVPGLSGHPLKLFSIAASRNSESMFPPVAFW